MGSTLDLINTFAAMAGTDVPDDRKMDGYDLSEVLKGNIQSSPRESFYYWRKNKVFAVRSDKWKLHIRQTEPVYYGNMKDMQRPELYEIESDISERHDLYDREPERVDQLLKMIKGHEADMDDALPDELVGKM